MRVRWRSTGVVVMLELLLGFTLLVVAVLSLFAVFPSGDKAVVRSVRMSQASEIARGLMEQKIRTSHAELSAAKGITTGQTTGSALSRGGHDLETQYFYQVEITEPNPDRKYVDIRVEVYWEEGARKQRHGCELETSKGELI